LSGVSHTIISTLDLCGFIVGGCTNMKSYPKTINKSPEPFKGYEHQNCPLGVGGGGWGVVHNQAFADFHFSWGFLKPTLGIYKG
jgi:hypothetical protein